MYVCLLYNCNKNSMKIVWIILQVTTIPLVQIILKALRVSVVHENDVPPEKGCLIISNHECKLDPFFILNAYGLKKSTVNIPFQFPVLNEYMDKFFLGKVIASFGGFAIGATIDQKARNLFYIRDVLMKKGSVLIFPEARLVNGDHKFEDFQKGYTYLMTPNTQVILAKLERFHSYGKHFFATKRPRITFHTIPSSVTKEEAMGIIKDFYSK